MSETNIGKAPTPTYCSNCGVEAKAIAKFCFACGEAIYRGPSIEALPRNQAEPAPPLPAEEAGTTQAQEQTLLVPLGPDFFAAPKAEQRVKPEVVAFTAAQKERIRAVETACLRRLSLTQSSQDQLSRKDSST